MTGDTRRHFNEELQDVQEQLMRMAGLAEEMVELASNALLERDREALAVLKDRDDAVDALEIALDEHILELMALQQPMASDLRFLFTALKISSALAVIAAIVSEYFGGSQNGLGYGITSNAAISRTAASWGYVVGACLLGPGHGVEDQPRVDVLAGGLDLLVAQLLQRLRLQQCESRFAQAHKH